MPEDRLEKTIDIKTNNRKLVISVFLRSIFAAVLNLIIYMSIIMLVSGLTQKKLYDEVYYYNPDTSESSLLYTIPTATESSSPPAGSATDPTQSSVPTEGSTTEGPTQTADPNIRTVPIYSQSPFANRVGDIIAQIFMLVLFLSFPYSILWTQGDKDANHVQFGHIQEDRLRGLKIGAVATLPAVLPFLYLVLCKLSVIPQNLFLIYRFFNITFWPLMNMMTGDSTAAAQVANYSWLAVLALLLVQGLVPLVSHIAYTLGYKHISVMEKFIYVDPKKKKKRRRRF